MIDFPNSPTLNQVFTAIGKSWVWDGAKWDAFGGASGNIPPVNGTITLPPGFYGIVRVENTSGAPITITLPPLPALGQTVLIKDTIGNATAYPITVSGGGVNIEGQPSIVIMYNYGWVDLYYTGTQWVQH